MDGESPTPGDYRMLVLDRLLDSKLNPRKTYPAAAQAELTASIKTKGVLTPLLVRPAGDEFFEIAAGHRRKRSALAAGLFEVPCVVREMTDSEFVEVLTVENLQREDLNELEEADGYRLLIETWRKARSEKGGRQASKEDVERAAERVGKSISHIYQRLKLADLDPEARQALLAGDMSAGHAILIARLQAADQKKALRAVKTSDLSVRGLAEWIGRAVHHDLAAAPFKKEDGALLPSAGACTSCPKRTGGNRELYPDLPAKKDYCGDPACYSSKLSAHTRSLLVDLKKEKESFVKLTHGYTIPPSSNAVFHYNAEVVKPGECSSAVKGVHIDGDRMGEVDLVCVDPKCKKHRGRNSLTRASKGDGRAAPLFERRKALDRRRKALAVQKISLAIRDSEQVPEIPVLLRLALCFGTQTKRDGLYDYDHEARKNVDPWSWVGEGGDGSVNMEQIVGKLWAQQIRPVLLARLMYNPNVDIEKLWRNAERAGALVGVETGKLLREAVKALPDPKAWAKLNPDGTPKKTAAVGSAPAATRKSVVQTSAKKKGGRPAAAGEIKRNAKEAVKKPRPAPAVEAAQPA